MSASNQVVEKRHIFVAKQKELTDTFELARDGDRFDFGRKGVLDKLGATDAADALSKVKARNVELDDLGAELVQIEAREISAAIADREKERNTPFRGGTVQHPANLDGRIKSFGELFVESKEFSESRDRKQNLPVVIDIALKTLFQTSAGFAPQSTRTGQVVEAVARPIQVLDLIPSRPLNQASEKYMLQTTRTHAAAERAEGAAFAESTFVYAEQTSDVRSIGDSIPVTDEQLEDEAQVAGLLDQQLRFGVMQRFDGQVLVGNGTAPNLRGINNVVGVQTQAKGTDPAIVAFLKALTNIRITGRASPNGAVLHPNNWIQILLTQDAQGNYLFGNPFSGPGPQSLFGIPIAQSDAQTLGTGLAGDFLNFCRIGERKGVEVEIGYIGTQFTEGKKTLRASMRACFTVYRPAAFCQITGLAS